MLGVDQSVKSRISYGGTAPANVRTQARLLEKAAGQSVGRGATSRFTFAIKRTVAIVGDAPE